MTDWRTPIFDFLGTKTGLTTINAMSQFEEPSEYVSFFALNDETLTTSNGEREYNAVDDLIDVHYTTYPLVSLQIDVRGASSFVKSRDLYFGLQTRNWIDELKAQGIQYMGVGSLTPIPNLQNGYIKDGFQFNLFFGYNNTITNQTDYGEVITWQ